MRLWTREPLGLADAAGFIGGMSIHTNTTASARQTASVLPKKAPPLQRDFVYLLVLTRSQLRSTELLLASLEVPYVVP